MAVPVVANLPPYTDNDVWKYIGETARQANKHDVFQIIQGPDHRRLELGFLTGETDEYGPALLGVLRLADTPDPAAVVCVEYDMDLELEGGSRCWVLRSLMVRPELQRRGFGGWLLTTLRAWIGLPLYPDTQMSPASTTLWNKLEDQLHYAAHDQDRLAEANDPMVLFRNRLTDRLAQERALWLLRSEEPNVITD